MTNKPIIITVGHDCNGPITHAIIPYAHKPSHYKKQKPTSVIINSNHFNKPKAFKNKKITMPNKKQVAWTDEDIISAYMAGVEKERKCQFLNQNIVIGTKCAATFMKGKRRLKQIKAQKFSSSKKHN
jgi:hypothetical protein